GRRYHRKETENPRLHAPHADDGGGAVRRFSSLVRHSVFSQRSGTFETERRNELCAFIGKVQAAGLCSTSASTPSGEGVSTKASMPRRRHRDSPPACTGWSPRGVDVAGAASIVRTIHNHFGASWVSTLHDRGLGRALRRE